MKTRIAIAGAFVFLLLAAVAYKCEVDNSAWQKTEEALMRLRSGLQYESIFQVRSKLADADSALAYYSSTWRVLPMNHRKRVADASRSISYLGQAVDWTSRDDQVVSIEALQLLASDHPEMIPFVSRSCSAGTVSTTGSAVAVAFVSVGAARLQSAIASSASAVQPKPFLMPANLARISHQKLGRGFPAMQF